VNFGRLLLCDSRATAAPPMMARYLLSCGLRVAGPLHTFGRGWSTAPVLHRRTGEAAGRRWIRPLLGGGYDVRKERP
jgi:hypothetical protein